MIGDADLQKRFPVAADNGLATPASLLDMRFMESWFASLSGGSRVLQFGYQDATLELTESSRMRHADIVAPGDGVGNEGRTSRVSHESNPSPLLLGNRMGCLLSRRSVDVQARRIRDTRQSVEGAGRTSKRDGCEVHGDAGQKRCRGDL